MLLFKKKEECIAGKPGNHHSANSFFFIGNNGFRFHVCHHQKTGVSACELHTIPWSVIKKIRSSMIGD